MTFQNYSFSVTERFLHYVTIDTQSDPQSETFPSSEKQKNLGSILVKELLDLGISAVELDSFGYVYATLPANNSKKTPIVCFCSHLDTSPDCLGKDVVPIIHQNYAGQDLVLPDDTTQIIRLAQHSDLAQQFGNDIITASGTTLLGADNKAGVAEIMDAVAFLIKHPEVKHGTIKILFTPDEEIGRGTAKVDLAKLGADIAYTIDGEALGSVENETFSADSLKLTIYGVSTHPGFAKNSMENSLKIAGEILAVLPKTHLSPESTQGKEGFIHPVFMEGTAEKTIIEWIIRDFDTQNLRQHGKVIENIVKKTLENYPNSRYEISQSEQYRNMKEVLDSFPQVTENALEAIRRAGLTPRLSSIRGGTDGSRLSFMGLPCPNIFAGEHAFHSKHEWISVQDMQKAVETIVHLATIWAE